MFNRLLCVFFLLCCCSIRSQGLPGFSAGFGYSFLEYGEQGGNHQSIYPAIFSAKIIDDNKQLLSGEMRLERKKICPGFLAHWEFIPSKLRRKKIYHVPGFFLSYQKDEMISNDMWALTYALRFKPSDSSTTGFSVGLLLFPRSVFKSELQNISRPDSANFMFRGKDYGDTVKLIFSESKMSFCPELTFHLGLGRRFEFRFSAGYYFSFRTRDQLKVISENGSLVYKMRAPLYGPGGSAVEYPLIRPGALFFRAALHLLTFTPTKRKVN
jgi:hypothetical protein